MAGSQQTHSWLTGNSQSANSQLTHSWRARRHRATTAPTTAAPPPVTAATAAIRQPKAIKTRAATDTRPRPVSALEWRLRPRAAIAGRHRPQEHAPPATPKRRGTLRHRAAMSSPAAANRSSRAPVTRTRAHQPKQTTPPPPSPDKRQHAPPPYASPRRSPNPPNLVGQKQHQ